MIPTLYALPGFLGRPADWNGLFSKSERLDVRAIDPCSGQKTQSLWTWAEEFNGRVEKSAEGLQILLGYSLGGRLALHALLSEPKRWDGAIIVSAHPGLKTNEEKLLRRQKDEQWAVRFEKDSWENLMKNWETQDVFPHDSFRFERFEKDYSRARLADILRLWSLGNQDNLTEQIAGIDKPILWIAGSKDKNYSMQAKQITLRHPLSKVWVVNEAGHRVPWQCPKQFLLEMKQFIEKIK